jgi:hypothetical protein
MHDVFSYPITGAMGTVENVQSGELGPGRSRMARAFSIQFLSGSHSSADLQSVHARKHSALAMALILAFVAKYPSSIALRKRSGTETAFVELRQPARQQLWWVIKMRVCIKLITSVGYRCWQLLAIAVGVVRLGLLS